MSQEQCRGRWNKGRTQSREGAGGGGAPGDQVEPEFPLALCL